MHLLTHLIGTATTMVTLAALVGGTFFAVIGTWLDDLNDLRQAGLLVLRGYGLIVVHGLVSHVAGVLPI